MVTVSLYNIKAVPDNVIQLFILYHMIIHHRITSGLSLHLLYHLDACSMIAVSLKLVALIVIKHLFS